MQTILESLESAYINILNLENEAKREIADTYIREEVYMAKSELIKAIVLLVNSKNVVPNDKRVYLDIVKGNNIFSKLVEEVRDTFIDILYKEGILIKEKTIGDLIEELQQFSPNLKVQAYGGKKLIVDDTYTDKVVIVGVEE